MSEPIDDTTKLEQQKRRLLHRGLLVVVMMAFGLFLAFVAVEVVFRLFPSALPQQVQLATGRGQSGLGAFVKTYKSMFAGDGYLGYKLKPGLDVELVGHPDFSFHVKTIDLGFKDIGFRDDGIDGSPDVIVIGDSFVFGYGVDAEEGWVERCEKLSGVDFVNMGVNGYSALAYTRMLERYGLALKPRHVLWCFVPNDFRDSETFKEWLDSGTKDFWQWGEQRAASQTAGPVGRLRQVITQNSISYQLFKFALRLGSYHRSFTYKRGDICLVFDLTGNLRSATNLQSPVVAEGRKLGLDALKRAADLCAERGVSFAVVICPFKEQVYEDILTQHFPEVADWHITEINNVVASFCRKNEIPCLDLTPALKVIGKDRQVYWRIDGHWNEEGNRIAAEEVLAFVKRLGWKLRKPGQ